VPPILLADNVSHLYPEGVQALENVRLQVWPEEFVCLIGPSGCGKSTLLRQLAGLLLPTGGRVLFEGQPLTAPHRRIGFVFQKANLMPWRTAQANITLPLELQGLPPAEAARRAAELIELVGLRGFEQSLPRQLSGGMEQRVALARALIHNPEVLLLDEPFGALDALTREHIAAELLRIWEAHKRTVIMVTHSITESLLLADRVVALTPRPGRVRLNLDVTLPRPRSPQMEYTPAFGTLAQHLREAIGLPVGD
jgi:NitT/TauT family transport system ATP-binding protein